MWEIGFQTVDKQHKNITQKNPSATVLVSEAAKMRVRYVGLFTNKPT